MLLPLPLPLPLPLLALPFQGCHMRTFFVSFFRLRSVLLVELVLGSRR